MHDSHPLYCIGHITHDRIVTPDFTKEMPGGTVYYFANALHRMDAPNFRVVTCVGQDEMDAVGELKDRGVRVTVLDSPSSVFFENIYGEDIDRRTQRVLAKARPFTLKNIKDRLNDNDYKQSSTIGGRPIFHLGTLLADDFDMETVSYLASLGDVSVDIQGYLRRVEEERVIHQDVADKEQLLSLTAILKANEEEMKVLTGSDDPVEAAGKLAEYGCREVVLTLGSKGSLIYTDGRFYRIPAYPPAAITDATGCGDTYMAGYLLKRSQGADPEEAGRFAAAMCSIKLSHTGPLCASEEDVYEFIKRHEGK